MPDPKATPVPSFEETEAEGSLRRIAEASRDLERSERALERAKLIAKEAKESCELARDRLRDVTRTETTELPLFEGHPGSLAPSEDTGSLFSRQESAEIEARLGAASSAPGMPVAPLIASFEVPDFRALKSRLRGNQGPS